MGYSAKSTKQLLEKKVQEDRYFAEAEKKRLIEEKERLAILKKIQQQLNRKLNSLAGKVIEFALSNQELQLALEKKVTADLSLRGELQRRGFEFDRRESAQEPAEKEYRPLARKLLKALRKIESLTPETANQIEQIVRKTDNGYIALSLAQWREITAIIDGRFSKNFDENNLNFENYQALCKKFDEIQDISIFDVEYDLELDCSEYSKEISPSEAIKKMVYDLGYYHIDKSVKLGDLFLRWENPGSLSPQYDDEFFTAEKVNWICSKKAIKFNQEVFDNIQECASNKKISMRLYLKSSGGDECEVSFSNKSYIHYPFSLNSLLDLLKKLGYQVKDQSLKDNDGEIRGSVSIAWS